MRDDALQDMPPESAPHGPRATLPPGEAEIRARLDAATPGPWERDDNEVWGRGGSPDCGPCLVRSLAAARTNSTDGGEVTQ